MRFIDLENLPKRTDSLGKEYIAWEESFGEKCYFEFDEEKGYMEIISVIKEGRHKFINFKYKNEIFKMRIDNFKNAKFSRVFKVRKQNERSNEFKFKINEVIHLEGKDLIILNRERRTVNYKSQTINDKYYLCKCSKCGYETWKVEGSILKSTGCPVCSIPSTKVLKGYNDIATTSPWILDFLVNKEDGYKYHDNSNKKVKMKCPYCGKIEEMSISNLKQRHTLPCVCRDGFPYDEKLFYHIVNEQLKLNMIFQANKNNFSWTENYIYDFVDEERKIIWELDGGLGHGNETHSKAKKTKEELKEIDRIKDKLGEQNGYRVIRIDTNYMEDRFNFIKQSILNSEFSKIYNVEDIDWDMANEFALKNLTKEVCEYYNDNPELSKVQIAKHFNISNVTLYKYLKQGDEIGWCNYKSK